MEPDFESGVLEYPLIDHKTGRLSKEFLEELKKNMDEEWLPHWDSNNNYRLDWNIIGIEFKYMFGFDSNIKRPSDIPYNIWIENIPKVREWLNWVSTRLFDPKLLVSRTWLTDRVLMRIATSKIDKMTLPRKYTDIMFDNMHYCYYIRKRVYDEYYHKVIMKLPF